MNLRNRTRCYLFLSFFIFSHTSFAFNPFPINKGLFLLGYTFEKIKEIPHMTPSHIQLIYTVGEINFHRTRSVHKYIPFKNLHPIHHIKYNTAKIKLEERVIKLKTHRELFQREQISWSLLNRVTPSVTPIKAVKIKKDFYVCFEGNGRYFALKKAFEDIQFKSIQVEVYKLDKKYKESLLDRIEKIYRKNLK